MSVPSSRLERSLTAFRAALIRQDAAAQRQIVRALALAEANLQPLVEALLVEIATLGDTTCRRRQRGSWRRTARCSSRSTWS